MLDGKESTVIDYLIAQSADLICICDQDGKVLKVNTALIESSGKTGNQLIGGSIETLFSEENQKLNDLLYSRALNLDEDEYFINNIQNPDNSLNPVSWQISKFKDLRIIRGVVSKRYVSTQPLNSDERLKAIVESSSDCFFILDKDLNLIYQNKAATKKFAHPQFKENTNSFFGSFPEETNIKFFGHFANALSTKSHLKFVEFSALLNCWFIIDVMPLGNELNILVNDISDTIVDHKINELELEIFELHISKSRPTNDILLMLLKGFENLYPSLETGISRVEDQKVWHVASPKLPLPYCKAINGRDINFCPCGSAAFRKKSVISYDIETDEHWTNNKHLVTPYGYRSCWSFPILSNKNLEVMATLSLFTKEHRVPTESESKSIARICNIIKIIFEDLKQDDAFSLMNNRYQMVTMATNDAIYDWNLKTNDVYWSENLHTIFGFTPQEAHQTKNWWIKHIHRDDRAETIKLLKTCLKEKESGWVAEYRLRCKNDTFKYVYNRGYIIYDSQNLPVSIIGAIQDVTALKERENKILSQNNKLKEIAQISSHDLRRPVTSILGLVNLFNTKDLADESNKMVIEYLQKATQELDDVIHSIVAKTLEAGGTIQDTNKFEIKPRPKPSENSELVD